MRSSFPGMRPARAAPHAVVHHIASQFSARIGETIGKFGGRRVQQNAGRLQRRGTKEYDSAAKLDSCTRLPVDHPHARNLSLLGIEDQTVHDAMRTHRHLAGFQRSGQSRVQTAEVRTRDAPASARPALMAGRAAIVSLGQDRGTPDRHQALAGKIFRDCVLDHNFSAIQFHRRQKMAVRKLRKPLFLARDADEILDVVVPGSDVLITDRPIHAETFALVGFKIQIAPTIGLPSPDYRTAPELAAANPQKWLAGFGGVRILLVVDEELAVPLVHSTAGFLDRLILLHPFAVAHPAVAHFPLGYMLNVVLIWIDGTSRFEHERLQPFFAQLLGSPAASNPEPTMIAS